MKYIEKIINKANSLKARLSYRNEAHHDHLIKLNILLHATSVVRMLNIGFNLLIFCIFIYYAIRIYPNTGAMIFIFFIAWIGFILNLGVHLIQIRLFHHRLRKVEAAIGKKMDWA